MIPSDYAFWPAAALILWNLAVFAMYGIDKQRARRGKWRISEKTLLLSAFCLGGPGAMCGMRVFRHKTKHGKFRVGVPLALILHILLLLLLFLPNNPMAGVFA